MLLDVWDQSGHKPVELEGHLDEDVPEFPWVWRWFCEQQTPLTYSELHSWQSFSGVTLERWEANLLLKLDSLR